MAVSSLAASKAQPRRLGTRPIDIIDELENVENDDDHVIKALSMIWAD